MKTCLMEDRARATWKDPREPSYALAPGGSWPQVPHLILFFGVEAPAKNAASSVSMLSRLAISSSARAIFRRCTWVTPLPQRDRSDAQYL